MSRGKRRERAGDDSWTPKRRGQHEEKRWSFSRGKANTHDDIENRRR